jgi:hypothetical protein
MLAHIIPVAASRVQVPSRSSLLLTWAAVLLCTAALGARALLAERDTVDDVFIFLRYARNLAEHGVYAFNVAGPGGPAEGTSSPLWTLVLAAAWRAGWRGIGSAKLLSLAVGLSLPSVCALAVRRAAPARPWLAAVPALALALDADLATWTVSGMDTVLWTLACAACVVLADRPRAAAVALGALAWVRPEGPLFAALGVLALAHDRRSFVRLALLAAAPIVLLTIGRLAVFHAALPNTFWAKMNAVDGKDYTGPGYVRSALLRRPMLLVLAPVATLVFRRSLPAQGRLALAMGVAALLFVLAAGGDWMPCRRMLVVSLPLGAIAAATVVARSRRRALLATVAGALAIEAALTTDHALDQTWRRDEWLDRRVISWRPSGRPFRDPYPVDWMPRFLLAQIASSVKPGDTVAHVDVGQLPYIMGDVAFLDGFGLVDRVAGRLAFSPSDTGLRAAAREEFFDARPAAAIVVLDEKTGHPFSPAQDAFVADPRFAAGWQETTRVPTWGDHPCVIYARRDVARTTRAQAEARQQAWLARVPDLFVLAD